MQPDLMTKTPAEAIQFASRSEAAAAAKSIGWRTADAQPIEIMGFCLWTIMDEHMSMLRREAFATLKESR